MLMIIMFVLKVQRTSVLLSACFPLQRMTVCSCVFACYQSVLLSFPLQLSHFFIQSQANVVQREGVSQRIKFQQVS